MNLRSKIVSLLISKDYLKLFYKTTYIISFCHTLLLQWTLSNDCSLTKDNVYLTKDSE